MKVLNIISHSEAETEALAEKLAASFKSGDVLVLEGKLGSGKTVFVRGLARGRGIDERLVSSPSFTLVHEYPGDLPLYHVDLYRIDDPGELYEIGLDEYLGRDGVVAVEWGEKAERLLPHPHYVVQFTILGETEREINIALV